MEIAGRDDSLGNSFTCKKEVNIGNNSANNSSGMEGEVVPSSFNLVYEKLIQNTNLNKNIEIYYTGEAGVGKGRKPRIKISNAGVNMGIIVGKGVLIIICIAYI